MDKTSRSFWSKSEQETVESTLVLIRECERVEVVFQK